MSIQYDLVVIGGGSGGLATAKRAASYGKRVAVIEKSRIGGTCVNVGCMPKKVMYNAATMKEMFGLSQSYGFQSDITDFSWKTLKDRRDAYVTRLNAQHKSSLDKLKIDYYHGFGHFVGPHQVQVDDREILVSQAILISTGDKPGELDIPGKEYLSNSDKFWEVVEQPKKAVVVGGGYIAVELACILGILGTETTLVCRYDTPLRKYDPFITDILKEELSKCHVTLLPHSQLLSVCPDVSSSSSSSSTTTTPPTFTCSFTNDVSISHVDYVLLAIGRTPLLSGLNLEGVGVHVSDAGYVIVNEYQQCTADGIFCVGDNIGRVDLTPVAIQAGRRLADRLFGNLPTSKMDFENVPSVVFSHPPIGTVGMTESEAKKKYGDDNVRVYSTTYSDTLYALCPAEQKHKTGQKIVCVKNTGVVVGVHIIGHGADEMLQGFAVAVKMGATKLDLDSCCAIHPTAAEELVTMAPWGVFP